jgi:hypothetical protein
MSVAPELLALSRRRRSGSPDPGRLQLLKHNRRRPERTLV